MDTSTKTKDFLSFVEKISQFPEVQEALQLLQKRYSLNGNLILFCCWLGIHEKRELYSPELNRIMERFSPWHIQIHEELKNISAQFPREPKKAALKEIRAMIDDLLTLANQTEQAIMTNDLKEFEIPIERSGEPEDEKQPLHFGLTNLFKYLRYQHVQLHQNDLEKVYRIITKGVEVA